MTASCCTYKQLCNDFFFIFKLPGKVTRQTYFKLITYRFSHGPTWTSQSSPTRAWNANQGAWVLCILMMEQSLFVTLNGGWGGGVLDVGSGHKWQALSKGGRRHEKKKEKKRKIFEAIGSFDYRFDYLVLSAEFSCSNNNNRSKKYIIYQQEFIVTASSPNASLIGSLLDAFFHRLVNNILQWLCFFRLNWLLLTAHYGHCLY